jgi:hypothetical protein
MEKKTIGKFAVTDELSVDLSTTDKPEDEMYPYSISLIHTGEGSKVVFFEEHSNRPDAIERFVELIGALTNMGQEECE